jgi:hypothetical protein
VSEKPVNRLPLTEEQIQAKTVGGIGAILGEGSDRRLRLAWPDLFKCEAKRLRNVGSPRSHCSTLRDVVLAFRPASHSQELPLA